MSRKVQTLLGCVALLLAGVSGYAVYVYFDRLTTLATLPVPAQVIPAGSLILPEMLTEREVPRALLDEPVYVAAADLAGKVAQVPLQPGMVVYQAFAVSPSAYRLVDDPALVVAALPVDPARAVGGQIQPGHHIDLWQLPKVRQGDVAATPITPTLVLSDVLVVDVRSSSGQAVGRLPQAVPGESATQGSSQQQALPLQILTVAVPVSRTETLMSLIAADRANDAFLWAALSPLVRPAVTEKALPDSSQRCTYGAGHAHVHTRDPALAHGAAHPRGHADAHTDGATSRRRAGGGRHRWGTASGARCTRRAGGRRATGGRGGRGPGRPGARCRGRSLVSLHATR